MSSVAIYLKLTLANGGTVKGPSRDADHKEHILLESYHFAETNEGPAAGKAQAAHIGDFVCSAKMSVASPFLLVAAATNDRVVEAVISCRGLNAQEKADFLEWTLNDGRVTSYATSATSHEVHPLDHFSLSFRKIRVDYRSRMGNGQLGGVVTGAFDLGTASGKSG